MTFFVGPGEQSLQNQEIKDVFRNQLTACLDECARGRCGLFSNREGLSDTAGNDLSWPQAERLRELAFALQAILAQSEESYELCDQFLDLCSIHGESDPGEPKLARAFLAQIEGDS